MFNSKWEAYFCGEQGGKPHCLACLQEKCTGTVTDGAKSVVGSKTSLVGHLKQLEVKCVLIHCIIHQEVLCGKIMKMNHRMKTVLNTVSVIRGRNKAQRH
jgi:hypothetical protein